LNIKLIFKSDSKENNYIQQENNYILLKIYKERNNLCEWKYQDNRYAFLSGGQSTLYVIPYTAKFSFVSSL